MFPATSGLEQVEVMRVLGLDLYLGRGYPFDPVCGLVREPGSIEVNLLGWTFIVAREWVQSAAPVTEPSYDHLLTLASLLDGGHGPKQGEAYGAQSEPAHPRV